MVWIIYGWMYVFWLSLSISLLSVERQEAEPAGIKHAEGDGDSQQTFGGVEMTSCNLVTYNKRCLRQRANYRGGKTLVFLMDLVNANKHQSWAKILAGQPLNFCVQHLALNFFSLLFKIGEKASFFFFFLSLFSLLFYFIFLHLRCLRLFFNFSFYNVKNRVDWKVPCLTW